MLLYHFTTHDHFKSIEREGLTRGEVPLSATRVLNAVWLTSDRAPGGHGIATETREMSMEEKAGLLRLDPKLDISRPLLVANKSEVRISVRVPAGDRNLVAWQRWARKRLAPEWYDALSRSGGQKHKTWFLYWGVIPPSWFTAVDVLCPAE